MIKLTLITKSGCKQKNLRDESRRIQIEAMGRAIQLYYTSDDIGPGSK
jgi:hypothetical protein